MHRSLAASTYVVLVALVLGLIGLLAQSATASTLVAGVTGQQPAEATPLRLQGDVPELWPGHRTTLTVRVTSTSDTESVKIVSLKVKVGDAAPGCLAGNLAVVDYALSADGAPVVVEPGGTATLSLPLTMLNTDTNQDACKGVTFPLSFTATTVAV